jgi:hypothetical protein
MENDKPHAGMTELPADTGSIKPDTDSLLTTHPLPFHVSPLTLLTDSLPQAFQTQDHQIDNPYTSQVSLTERLLATPPLFKDTQGFSEDDIAVSSTNYL